jgi:DNA-binding LytR/AlgR family response regulator
VAGGAGARAVVGGPPFVVFVTAYDEYAVSAFDAGAVDYLTKPVTPARLERAMARVHERVAAAAARAERLSRPGGAPAASPAPGSPPETLVARVGLREVVIPVAAVTLLEADGVYTAVHVSGRRHLVRCSLDELERVLGPAHFLRVHRSYLVRRSAIVEARLSAGVRRRELVLAGGTAVPVSRRRQAGVARALRA